MTLDEANRDKCHLLFKLEEVQDEKEEIQRNLLLRIEELKGDISRYNELYELEKKSLQKDFDVRLHEVQKERNQQEERVRQLEHQLSTFRQELEIVGVSITSDLVEMDAEMDSVLSHGKQSHTKHTEGDRELLEKIRELVKSETSLRQRIYDLEKKVGENNYWFLILCMTLLPFIPSQFQITHQKPMLQGTCFPTYYFNISNQCPA